MTNAIEEELIRATEFAPEKEYKNRQDYLCALFLAASDLSQEAFDGLTEEAYEWCKVAAKAYREGGVFKDFDGSHQGPHTGATVHVSADALHPLEYDEPAGNEPYPEPEAVSSPQEPAKKKRVHRKVTPPQKGLTGEIDAFGFAVGTTKSKVAAFLTGGGTQKQVAEKFGQTHYNLVKKIEGDGHTVVKTGDMIKITPKPKG